MKSLPLIQTMQPCFEVVNIFINLLLWNVDGDISDLQFGVLGFWKNLTLSVERSFGAKPPCQSILQNKNKEDNSGSVPKRKFQ